MSDFVAGRDDYQEKELANLLEPILGSRLYEWSDADLDRLKDKVYECRKNNLAWQNVDPNYFYRQDALGAGANFIKLIKTSRAANRTYHEVRDKERSAAKQIIAELYKKLDNIAHGLDNDNLSADEIRSKKFEIDNLQMKYPYEARDQVRLGVSDRLAFADKEEVTKLKAAIKSLREQYDERLMEAERKKQGELAVENAKESNKDIAVQMITYYALVDLCQQNGQVFDLAEAESVKIETRSALDAASVPQNVRDTQWNIAQSAINHSGLRQASSSVLSNECEATRKTLVYVFPRIFSKPETIGKSPF